MMHVLKQKTGRHRDEAQTPKQEQQQLDPLRVIRPVKEVMIIGLERVTKLFVTTLCLVPILLIPAESPGAQCHCIR